MRRTTLALPLALFPILLLAGAREDLARYQELELLRLEEPGKLSGPDARWRDEFATKYQRLFKKAPDGPTEAARAAYRRQKEAAARTAEEARREAERKRAAAEKAALGGVEPLLREIPIPAGPGKVPPEEPLDALEARLRRHGMDAAQDLAAMARQDLWGPLLDDAIAYWKRKGAAAFSDKAYTAAYLAQGYRSGYRGFPRNDVLAKSYRGLVKQLAQWVVADYQATHSMAPGQRPSGARPAPLRIQISATPPDELLRWAARNGMAGGPTPAQLDAEQKGRDRARFYAVLEKLRRGGGWNHQEKNWAREYERKERGLAPDANPPQFWAAWQAGLPVHNATIQANNARIAEESKQRARADKARAQLAGLRADVQSPTNTYLAIASGLEAGGGTRQDWENLAARIHPKAAEPMVVGWFRSAGHKDLAQMLEARYAGAFPAAAPAGGGSRPSRSSGPSTYDQARQAQERFEQYQRDSSMRGGNPNARPTWR